MMKRILAFLLTPMLLLTGMSFAAADEKPGSQAKISFTFPERKAEELNQLNAFLGSVKLSHISMDDFDGYLTKTTRTDGDGNVISTTFRYGFDSVELLCDLPAEGEEGYIYRVDTYVEDDDGKMDSDLFHEQWKAENPDRVMRMMSCIQYESSQKLAFVVLHHERQGKSSSK